MFFRAKILQLKNYDKSIQRANSTIKYRLNQVVNKKSWVKNKFLTIFIKFYKITNLLQREVVMSVEPCIHGEENITHQAYSISKTYNVKRLANNLCRKH